MTTLIGSHSPTSQQATSHSSGASHGSATRRASFRRLRYVSAAHAAGSLLVAATACSTGDGAAGAANGASATTTSAGSPAPPPPSTSQADQALHEVLDRVLESHHAAGDFVGARIALRSRDGTITEATAGSATIGTPGQPVDVDVPWNIGSATKTFVAVVTLQLADEGRLDLDAGIARYLPDLPGADRITPRELLQHTSGLGEYIDQPAVRNDARRAWTPSELIAVAEAAGRVGQPGGAHHYANTNYIVLGEIIEQVTGHPWADEVRSRITEPLGMTHTSEITDQRPTGYAVVDGGFVDATYRADPSIGGAAGALQSNGRDLLRFADALAHGTLLSARSQAAMQAFVPAEDLSQFGIDHGYGLGLERYRLDGMTVVGHMGTGEAQSAYVGYDPDHGSAVAVMTNTAVPGPAAIMAVETLTAVGGAD
jgi:D-alanyl-D-alanine carboxypeptidase